MGNRPFNTEAMKRRKKPVPHRRVLVTLASTICLLTPGAARAVPTETPRLPNPIVSAKVDKCVFALEEEARYVEFVASMQAEKRTDTLELRFEIQEKRRRAGWRDVTPLEIQEWHRAKEGSLKYVYRQRIDSLKLGAAYRAVVYFRVLDGEKVIGSRQRTSGVCKAKPQAY